MRQALIQAYYTQQGIDALSTWRAYEARQGWDTKRFTHYCEDLFLQALKRASSDCSYYRELGCTAAPDSFGPLDKRSIMDNRAALTVERHRDRRCFLGSTSGSTGRVLEVLVDIAERTARLGSAWRGDGMPAIPGGPAFEPWSPAVMLWGRTHVVKGGIQSLGHVVAENLFQKRILNCFHLDSRIMQSHYWKLVSLRPKRVIGYAGVLHRLALHGSEMGWPALKIEKVVPTAEQLTDKMASSINGLFQGPQRQRYGCRELGDIAAQCEYGSWHISTDFVFPEVLLPNGKIAREGRGTLLLTKLHNLVMPLIRYNIEDTVTLGGTSCPCGRAQPVMESFEGRYVDQLVSSEGRLINGLAVARVLRGIPYREFQAIQENIGECVLLLRPEPDFSRIHEAALQRNWAEFIGPGLGFKLELVEEIGCSQSGKRRQVVSIPLSLNRETGGM